MPSELFNSIRNDTELPEAAALDRRQAQGHRQAEQVQVQVLNGTDTPGKAKEVADELTAQGFVVTHVGNARPMAGNVPTTTLRYAKKDTAGAAYGDALAARLSGDKRAPVAGKVKPISTEAYVPPTPVAKPPTTGPVLQLVIGADWPGVRVPTKIPDSLKDQVVDNKTDPCQ